MSVFASPAAPSIDRRRARWLRYAAPVRRYVMWGALLFLVVGGMVFASLASAGVAAAAALAATPGSISSASPARTASCSAATW